MNSKTTEVRKFNIGDGNTLEIPIAFVIGAAPGPNAVITAGLHGGGYAGIFAATRLFHQLSPTDIKGTVKFITLGNRDTFEVGNVFLSLNSNELKAPFSSVRREPVREVLMTEIIDEIKGSDYHIDLNSPPPTHICIPVAAYHRGRRGELNDMSHEIAYYHGMPHILVTEANNSWHDAWTFYANVYEKVDIPSAFTMTSYDSKEENIRRHITGAINVLRRFGTMKGTAATPISRPQIYEGGVEWLFSKEAGLYVSTVELGAKVRRGHMIGYIADSFGRPIDKIIAPVNGRVLALAKNAAIEKDYFVASIGMTR